MSNLVLTLRLLVVLDLERGPLSDPLGVWTTYASYQSTHQMHSDIGCSQIRDEPEPVVLELEALLERLEDTGARGWQTCLCASIDFPGTPEQSEFLSAHQQPAFELHRLDTHLAETYPSSSMAQWARYAVIRDTVTHLIEKFRDHDHALLPGATRDLVEQRLREHAHRARELALASHEHRAERVGRDDLPLLRAVVADQPATFLPELFSDLPGTLSSHPLELFARQLRGRSSLGADSTPYSALEADLVSRGRFSDPDPLSPGRALHQHLIERAEHLAIEMLEESQELLVLSAHFPHIETSDKELGEVSLNTSLVGRFALPGFEGGRFGGPTVMLVPSSVVRAHTALKERRVRKFPTRKPWTSAPVPGDLTDDELDLALKLWSETGRDLGSSLTAARHALTER